jgi:hypothetical protein
MSSKFTVVEDSCEVRVTYADTNDGEALHTKGSAPARRIHAPIDRRAFSSKGKASLATGVDRDHATQALRNVDRYSSPTCPQPFAPCHQRFTLRSEPVDMRTMCAPPVGTHTRCRRKSYFYLSTASQHEKSSFSSSLRHHTKHHIHAPRITAPRSGF